MKAISREIVITKSSIDRMTVTSKKIMSLSSRVVLTTRERWNPIAQPTRFCGTSLRQDGKLILFVEILTSYLRSCPLSSDETSSMCTWSHSSRSLKKRWASARLKIISSIRKPKAIAAWASWKSAKNEQSAQGEKVDRRVYFLIALSIGAG